MNDGESKAMYSGPAVLGRGFRVFFLAAGVWAPTALVIWLLLLEGWITLPLALDPLAWHVHEMLFGYLGAAVAGFILTAVPNWTGRLPVRGGRLAALFGFWVAARIAGLTGSVWPPLAVAVVDAGFNALLAAVVTREIVVGRNLRNAPVAGLLWLLAFANVLVHVGAFADSSIGAVGHRLGIAVVAMLIALIGGRIVPSFTRNWLAKRGSPTLPAAFGIGDKAALAISGGAFLFWIVLPQATATGWLMVIAAVSNGIRLGRWCGARTLREPLLWVLHVGYGWLCVGMVLIGASALLASVPEVAATHALTAGAMGTMTLAVMTRATLGHTGRPLTAGPASATIYVLVVLAAVCRVVAGFPDMEGDLWRTIAADAWIAAFGLFVAIYGPMLLGRPRPAA
jgi:uncharacterized protein involved in response to NO